MKLLAASPASPSSISVTRSSGPSSFMTSHRSRAAPEEAERSDGLSIKYYTFMEKSVDQYNVFQKVCLCFPDLMTSYLFLLKGIHLFLETLINNILLKDHSISLFSYFFQFTRIFEVLNLTNHFDIKVVMISEYELAENTVPIFQVKHPVFLNAQFFYLYLSNCIYIIQIVCLL